MRFALPANILLLSVSACAGPPPGHPNGFTTAPVLVVTPLDFEYDAAVSTLSAKDQAVTDGRQVAFAKIGDRPVVVVRSGWGKAQAAGATAAMIARFSPSLVVMAGVGGGLRATPGDVVIVARTFQYDLGRITKGTLEIWPPETPVEKPYPEADFVASAAYVDAAWRAARTVHDARWALPAKCTCGKDGARIDCGGPGVPVGLETPNVCVGTVATGDTFITDPSFAARLAAERQVVAVDMETAAVAQEAANHGLPFVGIRVMGNVVNDASEGTYYCLKPQSGARLRHVLAAALPALVAATRTPENGSAEPPRPCRSVASPGK